VARIAKHHQPKVLFLENEAIRAIRVPVDLSKE